MAEDIIVDYLNKNDDTGNMIFLSGSWGSGKTYRWKHLISPYVQKNNKIYISLFGMKDIDDLKREIFNQYIDQNMCLSWKNKHLFIRNLLFMFFSMLFTCSIFTACIFYILNTFSTLREGYQLVYIVTAISILLYLVYHMKTVLIYLLNKFVGINHDTIQIDRIYNTNNTVFCFDDFERLADIASPDQFLGYFNTLSKVYGFNILIISSAENYAKHTTEYITKYQEKLFDHVINQDKSESLENLLDTQGVNDELKKYLLKIVNDLKKAYEEKNKYKEEEREYIEKSYNNLRLILKSIHHMKMIYNKISANELILEKIHNDVIRFVVAITYYFELGYFKTIDDYLGYPTGKDLYGLSQNQPKKFISIFQSIFSNNYISVYNLIYKGNVTDELYKELQPSKHYPYTDFEKIMNEFHNKHCLNYRTYELKKICKDADKSMNSKELFSSFGTMYSALGNYCILLHYLGKSFITHKTKGNIYKGISDLILRLGIPANYERTSFNWSSEDQNIKEDFTNIREYVYAENVNIIHHRLLNKDVINEFLIENDKDDRSLIDIICLLIIANSSSINWINFSKIDYQSFNSFVHKFSTSYIEKEFYKKVCHILNYPLTSYKNLVDNIVSAVTELKDKSPKYSTEVQNYKNYEESFKSLSRRDLYIDFVNIRKNNQ